MDGLAGRVFRGNLHPVELGGRLIREADLTVHQTPSGPGVSNEWTISIHPADLQDVEVPDPLVTELAAGLEQTAAERGWRLEGPCTVRVVLDESRHTGNRRLSRGDTARRPSGVGLLDGARAGGAPSQPGCCGALLVVRCRAPPPRGESHPCPDLA